MTINSFITNACADEGYISKVESVVLEDLISLDFKNIEIIDALKFLAQKSGLNIVPTQSVVGRVNLTVEDAAIQDVFDVMLRSHGLAYDKKGSIYNIMTEAEYKELYGRNFVDMREVKIFNLQYAIPEHVYNLCDSLKSDIGKIILDAESGSILIMDTPTKLAEIATVIESLEKKTTILKVFNLQYANASDIEAQLKNQLDLKKVGTIRAEERSNQLIVQTLPDRIGDIEKIIERLDQKTQEVLLDIKIIKVNLSNR